MRNLQQNFNSVTNIFILILLFFGGLSYADTNGVWQFANDTRGGTFGGDEQGFTTDYTFINPVYFNLDLHLNGFSTFTQLNGNLLYANNVTIGNQLTLTGINCGANSKLRTDAFGNVICSVDNINDSVHDLATMKTAVSNNFHNLGGVDKDTWITRQTCGAGQILTSVGKNSKICVNDTKNYIKDGVTWPEVTGKPTQKDCLNGKYMYSINIGGASIGCKNLPVPGITTETDPQVRTVTNGKWCKGVAGGKIDCNSAAPTRIDTNAGTICTGAYSFLDGAGVCRSFTNIFVNEGEDLYSPVVGGWGSNNCPAGSLDGAEQYIDFKCGVSDSFTCQDRECIGNSCTPSYRTVTCVVKKRWVLY